MVEKAKQLVAEELEANPDDVVLDLDGGRFHVTGAPEPSLSWAELATRLASKGTLAELAVEHDFKPESGTFPFGAHVAVVEVDTETGHTDLQRIVAVDDAGRIISPTLAEGQRHGGIGSGIGQALFEEFVYDANGNPLTGNFVGYAFPSAAELPSFELVPDGDADADERARREGHRRVGDDRRHASGPQRGRRRARRARRAPRGHARERRERLARDPGRPCRVTSCCKADELAQDELAQVSWPRDDAKLARVHALMAERELDALVVRAPDNVLYLTDYWCMKGYDLAVFPREGEPALIVLEPQAEEAERSWAGAVELFAATTRLTRGRRRRGRSRRRRR